MTEVPNVLITGINGFIGQHLGRYLLSCNISVTGVGRQQTPRLHHRQLHYETCDLLDSPRLLDVLERCNPDYIVHLAAANPSANSQMDVPYIFKINVQGTLNLLEAVRMRGTGRLRRMLVIGSSHEYAVPKGLFTSCLNEKKRVGPVTPYGWSKFMQTHVSQMYAQNYSIPVIIARTFNLLGPGATKGFCAGIARQIVQMEHGHHAYKLVLGNTDKRRDFLDVRDAVRAYWALIQLRNPLFGTIYNVCSGTAPRLDRIVALFRKYADVSFETSIDASLLRHHDPKTIRGSNRKLRSTTAWRPSIPLETSVRDMLDGMRTRFYQSREGGPLDEGDDDFRNTS